MKLLRRKARFTFTTSRLLVLYFTVAIFIGTFLLLLPVSMRNDVESLSFTDALFTATSAMCVTGLGVRDTGHEFTLFGQVIILLLIQLGGIGILAFSNILFMARFGSFGLRERSMLSETIGLHSTITPAQLVLRVFRFVFLTEAIGAVILTVRFSVDYPIGKAIWLGLFHSVSAFCNAGFSLFSDSLIGYRDDLVVNFTIMALIIAGGLGFIVVAELASIRHQRRNRKKFRISLHSRVVIRMTIILILGGWAAFFVMQLLTTPSGSAGNVWLESLFFSVTARTAGFNTADVSSLSNAGILILMLLMSVGGSPGSTAGGMKTTTLATMFALIRSRASNRPKVELLDRTLSHEVQGKALAAAAGFFITTIVATVLLEIIENSQLTHTETSRVFLPHLFEVVSALATVGLSTGITAEISSPGKAILVLCMFLGRLGPVIVANSVIGVRKRLDYSYPEERMMVG